MPTPTQLTRYPIPVPIHIGNNHQTARLYRLEEAACEAVKKAAVELHKVLALPTNTGVYSESFWGQALPSEILTLLDQLGASGEAAAIGYLQSRGFIVTRPTEAPETL